MTGLFVIHWTIRLSLAAFLACLLGWVLRRRWASEWPGRLVWTFGVIAFGLHLLSAFAFYHHWSHAHALAHTADETERLMGWRFGEGIYFSYFFALLWAADVVWWWVAPQAYGRRPAWVHALIIGYLIFIAFHGAIVFEGGPTRYVGMAGCLLLITLAVRQWYVGKQRVAASAEAGAS